MPVSGLSTSPSSFSLSGLATVSTPTYALSFNGTSAFLDCGTLGTFGSNWGSGVYCSFVIQTSDSGTNVFPFGTLNAGSIDVFRIIFNNGGVLGKVEIQLIDHIGNTLAGNFTNASLPNGTTHTVTLTLTPSTHTIVATVDGANQTITYDNTDIGSNFVNMTKKLYIGGQSNNNTISGRINAIIDDFRLGTSAANLFAWYKMDEGTGTTTADSSGKANTATLSGSPLPSWVTGL